MSAYAVVAHTITASRGIASRNLSGVVFMYSMRVFRGGRSFVIPSSFTTTASVKHNRTWEMDQIGCC